MVADIVKPLLTTLMVVFGWGGWFLTFQVFVSWALSWAMGGGRVTNAEMAEWVGWSVLFTAVPWLILRRLDRRPRN